VGEDPVDDARPAAASNRGLQRGLVRLVLGDVERLAVDLEGGRLRDSRLCGIRVHGVDEAQGPLLVVALWKLVSLVPVIPTRAGMLTRRSASE